MMIPRVPSGRVRVSPTAGQPLSYTQVTGASARAGPVGSKPIIGVNSPTMVAGDNHDPKVSGAKPSGRFALQRPKFAPMPPSTSAAAGRPHLSTSDASRELPDPCLRFRRRIYRELITQRCQCLTYNDDIYLLPKAV